MSKFYFFNQNNSGGSFDVNVYVAEYVIIEANDYKDANKRAEDIGIYFNGCASGADCSCCGDRWNDQWDDDDATDVPSIYDTPVPEYKGSMWDKDYRIHYIDGRVERGTIKKK